MPDSTTPDTAAVLNQRSLWATALRHAGVAYLISRLCVMVGAAIVAAELAAQINGTNWISANPTHGLLAAASGAQITITAARYGTVSTNGNLVTFGSGTRFPGLVPGNTIRINGAADTTAGCRRRTKGTPTWASWSLWHWQV